MRIDGRSHGERTKAGTGAAEYNAAIARAFKTGEGHPFYYDTTWDVMRLIDYLATRKDVDSARIGLTGISKGGIETYLTAAADPRVAAAVSYIGVQSFRWALDNGQWRARIATIQDGFDASAAAASKPSSSVDFVRQFYARVVPGIDGQFDGPAMLAAISPAAPASRQWRLGCQHTDCRSTIIGDGGEAFVTRRPTLVTDYSSSCKRTRRIA